MLIAAGPCLASCMVLDTLLSVCASDQPGYTCSVWLASHGMGQNRKYHRVSSQAFVGFRKASLPYLKLVVKAILHFLIYDQ